MEAVVAVLPELPGVRLDAVAAPVLAHRQLGAGVLAVELLDAPLEPLAVGHRPALRRRERAELAGARAAARVGLALGPVDARDRALDPHLAAERGPVEEEGGVRVRARARRPCGSP